LFVGRITQNYSTDFHKIRWKGGTWPRKKRSDFDSHPDLDPDPGIFEGIFAIAEFATGKGSSSLGRQQSENIVGWRSSD